jgi:D-proline reductase (dithiol) PrdB
MAPPLEEQRAALDPWLAAAHDALVTRDWRTAFAGYPRADLADESIPWAAPPADIRRARLTLVSSCGLSAPGQPPFDAASPLGDCTWRALPADLALNTTRLDHDHYDHAPALRDRNCIFPLDRLRELVAAGELGGLTPRHFSFMGYLPDWRIVLDRLAPELAAQVAAEAPDAVLLVPV